MRTLILAAIAALSLPFAANAQDAAPELTVERAPVVDAPPMSAPGPIDAPGKNPNAPPKKEGLAEKGGGAVGGVVGSTMASAVGGPIAGVAGGYVGRKIGGGAVSIVKKVIGKDDDDDGKVELAADAPAAAQDAAAVAPEKLEDPLAGAPDAGTPEV